LNNSLQVLQVLQSQEGLHYECGSSFVCRALRDWAPRGALENRHSGRTTGRFTGGCLWSWCVLARHYEAGKQRTLCHKTAGALFYAMGALYT
jgi:hypothetical protein